MDWNPFWAIIEEAYRPDPIAHIHALTQQLSGLKWPEIIEFQARFDEAVATANLIDLWGAAHLINGGCSADGFRHFRVWLVARGRDVYEQALRDPDTLANVLDGQPVDGFGLDAAALRAYEARTGTSDFYQRLGRANAAAPPAGARWDFDDEAELRRRFPRLCELYSPAPDPPDEIVERE
jgi:hypothetical protein